MPQRSVFRPLRGPLSRHTLPILSLLLVLCTASTASRSHRVTYLSDDFDDTPLPLVIWHGLGDNYAAEGLQEVAALAADVNPGTYVHLIRLGDSPAADRQETFLGNVTDQVAHVCDQLAADPILSTAPAINALGFSQGGQFLRAYVQRCNKPPVHTLVTFGSQHNGISEFEDCQTAGDWICRSVNGLLRFGRWSDFVQARLVPAQYFRDPAELDQYLDHSNFLADINNERAVKNPRYKANLQTLERFAMFIFENDTTAVPKESGWFGDVDPDTGNVTALQDRALYTEDWLGLRSLDCQGKLDFHSVPGRHMQLTEKLLTAVFAQYFNVTADQVAKPVSPPKFVVQSGLS
jgi:palmitoyl-protein thioesterase